MLKEVLTSNKCTHNNQLHKFCHGLLIMRHFLFNLRSIVMYIYCLLVFLVTTIKLGELLFHVVPLKWVNEVLKFSNNFSFSSTTEPIKLTLFPIIDSPNLIPWIFDPVKLLNLLHDIEFHIHKPVDLTNHILFYHMGLGCQKTARYSTYLAFIIHYWWTMKNFLISLW